MAFSWILMSSQVHEFSVEIENNMAYEFVK